MDKLAFEIPPILGSAANKPSANRFLLLVFFIFFFFLFVSKKTHKEKNTIELVRDLSLKRIRPEITTTPVVLPVGGQRTKGVRGTPAAGIHAREQVRANNGPPGRQVRGPGVNPVKVPLTVADTAGHASGQGRTDPFPPARGGGPAGPRHRTTSSDPARPEGVPLPRTSWTGDVLGEGDKGGRGPARRRRRSTS